MSCTPSDPPKNHVFLDFVVSRGPVACGPISAIALESSCGPEAAYNKKLTVLTWDKKNYRPSKCRGPDGPAQHPDFLNRGMRGDTRGSSPPGKIRLPFLGAKIRLPFLGAGIRLPFVGAKMRLPFLGATIRLPFLGAQIGLPFLAAKIRLPFLGAKIRWPFLGATIRLPFWVPRLDCHFWVPKLDCHFGCQD